MIDQIFISKKRAVRELREATGLSWPTCVAAVARMPKWQDRCREKIHRDDVLGAIEWHKGIRSEARITAQDKKGLGKRVRARIRAGVLI